MDEARSSSRGRLREKQGAGIFPQHAAKLIEVLEDAVNWCFGCANGTVMVVEPMAEPGVDLRTTPGKRYIKETRNLLCSGDNHSLFSPCFS
jgi:hypothetical protein